MQKPDVESIDGLSPAISIEQRSAGRNPRSTVATVTEIYDYLRLLYARIGTPYCYNCGRKIQRQTVQQIVDSVMRLPEGAKIRVLAPVVRGRKGEFQNSVKEIQRQGFVRIRVDGTMRSVGSRLQLNKQKKHSIEVVVDRLVVQKKVRERLADSIETAINLSSGLVIIEHVGKEELLYSAHLACVSCDISYDELEPRMFSFNSPYGACPKCSGLGTQMEIDPDLVVPDRSKSLSQGAVVPIGEQPRGNWYSSILKAVAAHYGFNFVTPFDRLSQRVQEVLLYGSGDEKILFKHTTRDGRWRAESLRPFEGIIPNLNRRHKQTSSPGIRSWIERFMSTRPCPECNGARLRKVSLAVRVGEVSIADVVSKSILEAERFFAKLKLTKRQGQIARQILKEIRARLSFLVDVGLDYLTLDRSAGSLAGGEALRIRLATQIGARLVGVLYILDEPSVGLHQRDNKRLIRTLCRLRDLGNTVLVVEHDRQTIEAADYVVDLGPGAGTAGGSVVVAGSPAQVECSRKSLTGRYLSGRARIAVPSKRRLGNSQSLILRGATGHNLKHLEVEIPLGVFICVTGVSGSGKSTLINETLYRILAKRLFDARESPLAYERLQGMEHIDKVVDIDQSPIGRTPRSNPATYTGTFTFIRELFSRLPESRIRGYRPGRFSFNVEGGRCAACRGDGIVKIEMHFLPDVYIPCEVCKGKRYNRETLEVRYAGLNIAEVLELTVDEALELFRNVPRIRRRLELLRDVGLGYIHLGQQATTLSGGEAQRVKLSTELSKVATGRTLYILDEPTTGLHFEDVKMLLAVLNTLVEKGNTVIVIEHNLDVIKSADYIIDLGPEGGDKGGQLVAKGTPERVARDRRSYTGKFLCEVLQADGKKSLGLGVTSR